LERLKQQNRLSLATGEHRNLFSRAWRKHSNSKLNSLCADLSPLQYADLLEWMTTLTHEPYYCLGIWRANTICIGQDAIGKHLNSAAERQFRQLGLLELQGAVSKVWAYAQSRMSMQNR
jgi:hypothetical protein